MAHAKAAAPPFYGLMAEFDSAQALFDAAKRVGEAGYTKTDAYSPFPIHGLHEALGFKERLVAPIVLIGGISGVLAGYGLQYWTQVMDWPMNIGGRPYHSWVSFIPVTFEVTILLSAFAAVFGMLALNGLPMPYHPVFNAPNFALASRDRFFLCIESKDPQFNHDETWAFLSKLGPRVVMDVEE
jgi:Protein of unknown function (DUF3341)